MVTRSRTAVTVAFFWPMLAMVAVTAAVWVRMYRLRIAEMKEKRIHPQAIAVSGTKHRLENTRAADNFQNLFEVPVLFYAISAVLLATNLGTPLLLAMAWAFVLLRAIHSAIQCSYNKVMHRFGVYVASTLVVLAMWAYTAIRLATLQ